MSATAMYPETEPTLHDVIDIMQKGFARIETKFDQIDERFENIDERFEQVEIRLDDMHLQLEEMKQDMRNLHRSQHRLVIQDEDRADTVLNHEERIGELELWKNGVGQQKIVGA